MANGTRTGNRTDPYRAYNFKLSFQPSLTEAHFTECSGLRIKVPAIAYAEGGNMGEVIRLPGQVQYGDITLRYGLTDSSDMWNWMMDLVEGTVSRRNASIILLDNDGSTPKMQWNLINAWPTEWRGAPLDALCQEVAIESLTLVFEKLKRD